MRHLFVIALLHLILVVETGSFVFKSSSSIFVSSFSPTLLTRSSINGRQNFQDRRITQAWAKSKDTEGTDNVDPLTKASWYAVELFGKAFANKDDKKESSASTSNLDMSVPPKSVEETMKRIELDTIERSYFLSGKVDTLIYDSDCIFADPFVSFAGRDRFVENLANLGSFITKYDAKLLKLKESMNEDGDKPTIETKLMVKLELNLPWKPVLAWPWGVKYEIDPSTNLIVKHIESWDIEPLEGVKQIFRKPTVAI